MGFEIAKDGIRAEGKGLEAVKNFPIAVKTQSVHSFLGLCSYFRRFIKNFSTIAKPLYELLRKDEKFKFEKKELDSFQQLKDNLVEAPVLAMFDHKKETDLDCDASALGFGGGIDAKRA